jgi:hypothetical protein
VPSGDGCRKDLSMGVDYPKRSAEQANLSSEAGYRKCLLDRTSFDQGVCLGREYIKRWAGGLNARTNTFWDGYSTMEWECSKTLFRQRRIIRGQLNREVQKGIEFR